MRAVCLWSKEWINKVRDESRVKASMPLRQVLFLSVVFCLFGAPLYSQDYPRRIISLGPAVTEGLYLLGAEERMIANTVYCQTPQGREEKEKIGTVIRVSLERIVHLKSDLILATSLTDRKQLAALKDLKLNVVEIPTARNFQEVCLNFLELGRLIGKDDQAIKIIQQAKDEVDFIRGQTKGLAKPRVMVQIGAKPLFVATREYAVNDFVELSGGINITADLKRGIYSREEALKQNPDYIIITTMGLAGAAEKESWQRYTALDAVKNDRIYIIDSEKLCAPTPLSFIGTLREMVKILHPDAE